MFFLMRWRRILLQKPSEKGSDIGKDYNVDFVIGIGGGSPMDAAKAMAVFIKNPQINKNNIFGSNDPLVKLVDDCIYWDTGPST